MSRMIESTGPDIDSAIAQGLADLGVTRAQVTIEILEQPMRRMLNLGVRLARVKLTVIEEGEAGMTGAPAPIVDRTPATEPITEAPIHPVADHSMVEPVPAPPMPIPMVETGVSVAQTLAAPKPAAPIKSPPTRAPRRIMDEDDRAVSEELTDVTTDPISAAQTEREAEVGVAVVTQILTYMGIPSQVSVRRVEAQRGEPRHWLIEVRGDNLGLLVGTKGETVAALQYITRLMVSRQVGHHANLVIDVDGYKARREDMLKRLAQRMAAQAIQMKRTVSLEPMPPHERRIVHMTLRNHPDVTTESVGDGDKRKVTIVPRHR